MRRCFGYFCVDIWEQIVFNSRELEAKFYKECRASISTFQIRKHIKYLPI